MGWEIGGKLAENKKIIKNIYLASAELSCPYMCFP
jgi:hypothetical protein